MPVQIGAMAHHFTDPTGLLSDCHRRIEMFVGTLEAVGQVINRLWRNLRNSRLAVNFRGADHFTPTDAIWLLKNIPGMAVPVGSMGSEKTILALRNFVIAFFDASLRNASEARLLRSPLPEYSGAIVIMQNQDLCPVARSVAQGALRR